MTRTNGSKVLPISTVFLDRDGVINRTMPAGGYVETWEQFEFLPGVITALRKLHHAGIRSVVVTNQRGVARGIVSMRSLNRIHGRMTDALERSGAPVQAVLVCPHDEQACTCRKPALGLFKIAQRMFPDVDFSRAAVIGDSWRDMKAANDLGSRALLIGDPETLGLRDAIRLDGFAPSLLQVVKRFVVSGDPTP